MQVRGLKHVMRDIYGWSYFAPHAGAWIETRLVLMANSRVLFAPHAGAWIETFGFYGHEVRMLLRTSCRCVD